MNTRLLGIIGGLALVLALLSPYVLGSSKKVEQLFEAAEALYKQNDYEAAIVKYKEALKESNKLRVKTEFIDPDFKTLVNLKIATSYVKLAEQEDNPSRYEKALEHVEKAAQTVTFAKHQEDLTYLWGQILYKTGELEKASEKFSELIENFPNSRFVEEAQEIIAQINEQLPDSKAQEREATPARDSIPLWINDLSKFEAFNKKKNRTLVIPNRLRAEKQYVKAAEQYEISAKVNPSTKEVVYALYWAGWCYHKASSNDETALSKAISVFQRLIDNYNDSRYTSAAKEKAKSGSAKAITTAEEAMYRTEQLNCKSTLIFKAIDHLNNGKQKQEQGHYEAAYQSAKKAGDIAKRAINNHKTAERHVNQGYNYLSQGQLEIATKDAREARRVHPSYQNANILLEEIRQKYFNQGVKYIDQQQYLKAIQSLKKAINIAPFKEAYYNLGRAYLQLGEFKKTIAAANEALAIDSNYKSAKDLIDSIDISEN